MTLMISTLTPCPSPVEEEGSFERACGARIALEAA